jgi:hypothetical protein
MNGRLSVSPTDLRDFAKARGWALLPDGGGDRLYVLQNARFPKRQLVFPMDTTAPDYAEAAILVAGKLAEMENLPMGVLLAQLKELRDGTLRFRITTDRDSEASLPLAFAESILRGTEQLVLSAACTVLKPQAHHPRLVRAEAQQLLEASRFRHTEEGSFVLKVSCPVNALDVQAPLLPDETEAPFVRRATLALSRDHRPSVNRTKP